MSEVDPGIAGETTDSGTNLVTQTEPRRPALNAPGRFR